MTGTEIMSVVGFGVLIFVTISGAFWRMWGLIKAADDEGKKAQTDLATYKVHVAETFATKNGVSEQVGEMRKSLEGLGERMDRGFDGIRERMDRVIDAAHKPNRRQP